MKNYTTREKILRVLWAFVYWTLFRLSPGPAKSFRASLLRLMGAKIGRDVHIHPTVRITQPWRLKIGSWSAVGENVIIYNLGDMTIGKSVTISQGAHLCGGTHDFRDKRMPLIKSSVVIDDNVWICADAFIGPAITIGKGAVAGARAVVIKDVAPDEIVAGNPAKHVGVRKLKD